MRISVVKLTIALFSLIVGISSAYLVRLVYSNPVTSPVKIAQTELPSPASVTPSATTIEEEWEYLIKADVCLNPTINLPDFVPSLKKDEPHAVDFLIRHIPDRQLTNVHVAPYGMALRGEVAIYCLQDSWNKPWYRLKKEYGDRVKRILASEPGRYQSYLQSIIKSPKGSKEMMALWRTYYESRTSSAAQN